MRVIRDGFADIDDTQGNRLHTYVRVQLNDQQQIGVFTSPKSGPESVYAESDVRVKWRAGNCSHPVCFGKASRLTLSRLWAAQEATTSV